MGVRQHLKVDKYNWIIDIYYTIDEQQKGEIFDTLNRLGCTPSTIQSIESNLNNKYEDTGFAYSNYTQNYSIIVIHKASSVGEFINTFEHEKNHIEMHMCEALDINPYSEEAAHLSGDLAQIILEEFMYSIVTI